MEFVLLIVIIMFSVILHEVAHGYVAYLLGDSTAKQAGRLTLNPISHIDLFGTVILPTFFCLSVTLFLVGQNRCRIIRITCGGGSVNC